MICLPFICAGVGGTKRDIHGSVKAVASPSVFARSMVPDFEWNSLVKRLAGSRVEKLELLRAMPQNRHFVSASDVCKSCIPHCLLQLWCYEKKPRLISWNRQLDNMVRSRV
jgi:hypothetical protein